jgi:hypothetical protein
MKKGRVSCPLGQQRSEKVALLGLGLGKSRGKASFLPEAAGLHQFDPLSALEDTALGADGAAGIFEAAMLRHERERERGLAR